jgi:16S rRNA processing protein RimM
LTNKDNITIATIGKTIGLKGELKLHLLTDFPNQFKKNKIFKSQEFDLEIEYYNHKRGVVKFVGFDSPQDSKKLINKNLFSDIQKTKDEIKLSKNEYFYFDIIGCAIVDNGIDIGVVKDIQRFGNEDYLDVVFNNKGYLIPYIDRYITKVDIGLKTIYTKDAIYLKE